MWTLLKGAVGGFLGGAWGYIAAAGAALLAVLVILFQAKKAGKDEVIAVKAQKEVENAKKANEVERKVDVTRAADVHKQLRDKYSRD